MARSSDLKPLIEAATHGLQLPELVITRATLCVVIMLEILGVIAILACLQTIQCAKKKVDKHPLPLVR